MPLLSILYTARKGECSIKSEFSSRFTFPDPLRPSGIEFDLPRDSVVTLTLLDPAGQELAKLMESERLTAGTHNVDFVARGFGQGIYFYRLHVITNEKSFTDTKRIVIGS